MTVSTTFLALEGNVGCRFCSRIPTPVRLWRSSLSIRMALRVSTLSFACLRNFTAEWFLTTNVSPTRSDCVPSACCRHMTGA